MKIIKTVLFFMTVTLVISFNACEKADDYNLNNNIEIHVQDGKLAFSSVDQFKSAVKDFSDTIEHIISFKDVEEWEKKLNFQSLRHVYHDIENEYELIENSETLEAFKLKCQQNDYASKLNITEDNDIEFHIDFPTATLLNKNGEVIILGNLYRFTGNKEIMIIGTDAEKMEIALKTMRTDESNGIFVFNTRYENTFRGECGFEASLEKTSSNKKITGDWWIDGYIFKQSGSWRFIFWNKSVIKSKKKAWHGLWWNKHAVKLAWETGFRVDFTLEGVFFERWAGGTGWRQNNAHTINNTIALFDHTFAPFSRVGASYNYFSDAVDNETNNLWKFSCCPWDCSNCCECDIPHMHHGAFCGTGNCPD